MWEIKASGIEGLRESYTSVDEDAYYYILGSCLQLPASADSVFAIGLQAYKSDSYITELHDRINQRFEVSQIHDSLNEAFRYLKFHLPEAKFPKQIWMANTLFASSVFSAPEVLIIGLERYLGAEDTLVKQLPPQVFYQWIKEDMQAGYLLPDAVTGWASTHICEPVEGNLAEAIVQWGKILYLTEAALPKLPKHRILRYSKDEYTWATENVDAFWKYLVDEELLFKNDERDRNNFLKPGPFTVGLPEKGPDRLGQFLGWYMIRQYVRETKASVQEVLDAPYTEILKKQDFE